MCALHADERTGLMPASKSTELQTPNSKHHCRPQGRVPVLVHVAGQLTPPPPPPHPSRSEMVEKVNVALEAAGYSSAEVSRWAAEIPGAVEAAFAAGRRAHFAREMPGPPPGWFRKTGRKVGTSYPRYLVMTAYDEIVAYARTVGGGSSGDGTGSGSGGGSNGGERAIKLAGTAVDVPAALDATAPPSAMLLAEQPIDQKSVLVVSSRSSAVATGTKLHIVGDGGKAWQLEAESADVATTWAAAVTALAKLKALDADLFTRRAGGGIQQMRSDSGDGSGSGGYLDSSSTSVGSAVDGEGAGAGLLKQPRPSAAIAGQCEIKESFSKFCSRTLV